MSEIHPNESELQNFVLSGNYDLAMIEHIKICENCSATFNQYQQLFSTISHLESQAFEFDITKLVFEKLPRKKSYWAEKYQDHLIVTAISILCFGLLFYLVPIFSKVFSSLDTIKIYLLVLVLLFLSFILLYEMYKKYRYQLLMLNFN